MGNVFNILITGYEKQGVTLLGQVLREYGNIYPLILKSIGTDYKENFNCEDCIQTTVRYYIENKIYKLDKKYDWNMSLPPIIPKKDAHLLIGLDPYETMLNLEYISEKTLIILNTKSLKEKQDKSIGEIINFLDQFARVTISMNFDKLATVISKNPLVMVYVILGVICREFDNLIRFKYIKELLNSSIQEKTHYIKAFKLGYAIANR